MERAALPAAKALLDAIDTAINSNTFLLVADLGEPVQEQDTAAAVTTFIHDPGFGELIAAADAARCWGNWTVYDPELRRYVPDPDRHPALMVRLDATVTADRMDRAGFERHLRWLLTEAFSPYDKHVEPGTADRLVAEFCAELLDDPDPGAAPWAFAAIPPHFLHNSGYYSDSGNPSGPVYYFDGDDCDSCTAFHRDGDSILHLFLTNGSP
ncbi:hypothetical protein [Nocardia sp. NBC_01329]|uniref:hypothetical protein n=1 Tax=Nocardia sp. NBC_01329 TaxID=2903594 RepID=UPI002E0DA210|nr:hypothetical protein OG405_20740 [Nocardia sp. NBC_01329]